MGFRESKNNYFLQNCYIDERSLLHKKYIGALSRAVSGCFNKNKVEQMFNKTISIYVIALASLITTPVLADRDQMKIVGSSTVFPFSTTVAERFGKRTDFKTPMLFSHEERHLRQACSAVSST